MYNKCYKTMVETKHQGFNILLAKIYIKCYIMVLAYYNQA